MGATGCLCTQEHQHGNPHDQRRRVRGSAAVPWGEPVQHQRAVRASSQPSLKEDLKEEEREEEEELAGKLPMKEELLGKLDVAEEVSVALEAKEEL